MDNILGMAKQVDYESLYREAEVADEIDVMKHFLKALLKDSSLTGVERHYHYFAQTDNMTLKRILGNGLQQRGDVLGGYLCKELAQEKDEFRIADILHLLGMTYDAQYIAVVTPYLTNQDFDIRYKAIVALGWVGDPSTLSELSNHYGKEQEVLLKCFIITAMQQIFFRIPEVGGDVLVFLLSVFKEETHNDIIKVLVDTIQVIADLDFGLEFDEDTGEVVGDVAEARSNVVNYFKLV